MSVDNSILTSRPSHWILLLGAISLGLGGAAAASGNSPALGCALAGGFAYIIFAALSIRSPLLFVAVFLFSLEVLPPLFFSSLGGTPIYFSLLLLPIAPVIILLRFPDIHITFDPLGLGLVVFLGGTALSLPFGLMLSGMHAGMSGISRWLLLALTGLLYFLIRWSSPLRITRLEKWMLRLLLIGATLSATYGVVDFLWPIPFDHPAADQFIWLGSAILRRAQGVFYESSNFANFCGFFLTLTAATFLARKEHYLAIPRTLLLFLIPIFGLAVLVAFSRSTWLAVGVALAVFVWRSGLVKPRRAISFSVVFGAPLLLLWKYSPELWNYFLEARLGHLYEIFSDPNLATSGRFDTWLHVLSIISKNPQYLLFGIGYKTLPFTHLFHAEIVTDNGYLNLLLETGLLGLGGFLVFSSAILSTFTKLAHVGDDQLNFWSNLMFSAWCGELVQLLATDAYTFWRNMIVMMGIMALVLNRAERLERSCPSLKNSKPELRWSDAP